MLKPGMKTGGERSSGHKMSVLLSSADLVLGWSADGQTADSCSGTAKKKIKIKPKRKEELSAGVGTTELRKSKLESSKSKLKSKLLFKMFSNHFQIQISSFFVKFFVFSFHISEF